MRVLILSLSPGWKISFLFIHVFKICLLFLEFLAMILLLGFYVVKVKGFVIIYSSLSVLKKVVINDFLARSTMH